MRSAAAATSWKSEPLNPADPTKDVNFFSPRGAVAWRSGRFQVQASAYHANRTPSLNELHRRFAAGTAITNANPLLDPETLTGVEGGVLTQFSRASFRATAFFNDLDGAIANVTLTQTPTATVRQRQNSDSIRATGVEMEFDTRFSQRVQLQRPGGADVEPLPRLGGDAGARGQHRAAGADGAGRLRPDLGRTALVHRGDAAALQRRAVSTTTSTPSRSSWSRTRCGMRRVSRAITRGLNAFFAVENILDKEYDTARTPLRQIGWPRTVRVGARVSWQ